MSPKSRKKEKPSSDIRMPTSPGTLAKSLIRISKSDSRKPSPPGVIGNEMIVVTIGMIVTVSSKETLAWTAWEAQ
jgi:hypothetical protein